MGRLASEVGSRLRDLRKEARLNQAELGRAAGLSASQVSRLESGAQWGGEETLLALFEALAGRLGLEPAQVQARALGGAAPPAREPADGQYVQVPLFTAEDAATGGRLVREGRWPNTHVGLLRDVAGSEVDPDDMVLATVVGDSMEPTLTRGDVVLADRGQAAVPDDALYLLRIEDALLVRRVQRLPGGRARVASDNRAYGSFELDLRGPEGDVQVVGRVVWVSKRI